MTEPLVLMRHNVRDQVRVRRVKECALIALFRKCKCASRLRGSRGKQAPKLKEGME